MQYLLFAKNTFYQFISRVASSFIGFLITIIIAKYFGVFGYGEFTKITSYVALFYLILDFGLNAIYLNLERKDFKTFFYLRILISAILFLVLNLISSTFPYNSISQSGFSELTKIGILIFSLSLFSQSLILSSIAIFQKNESYSYYAKGIIIGSLVNLCFVFIFSFLNFSIFYVLISFVATGLLTGLIHIKDTKEKITPFLFDKQYAKKIFILSMPIGLMLIFNLVYFRADIFLLSLMSTTKSVGLYGLSYKFFDFIIAIPLFMSNSIYPLLIKYKNTEGDFKKIVGKYFLIFFSLSFIFIVLFWFASPLFSFIREDFSDAIFPFRILLLSLPFFFTTSFFQWVLITKDKQKFLMYIYFILLIINILLNIYLIPKYSYFASAWITVFSEGIVFIVLAIKTIRVLNYTRMGSKND
ncbi:MAG TPA: oligosaccharide flippase family protein [Candidatus Sulfotelmatobacter sp.]|nr:oligosaccharide flippase family protein [Candidatus Sulfotelmatobacter sp.]